MKRKPAAAELECPPTSVRRIRTAEELWSSAEEDVSDAPQEEAADEKEESGQEPEAAAAAAAIEAPASEAEEADDGKKKKGGVRRLETIEQCKKLGINLHGVPQGEGRPVLQGHDRAGHTHSGNMYLPAMFSPSEMSGLWQMLKGWVKKSSPGLKAKWDAISKLHGSHAAINSSSKMAILNLALVRKDDWEEHALNVSFSATETTAKKSEGKWLYRGELEAKLGKTARLACVC